MLELIYKVMKTIFVLFLFLSVKSPASQEGELKKKPSNIILFPAPSFSSSRLQEEPNFNAKQNSPADLIRFPGLDSKVFDGLLKAGLKSHRPLAKSQRDFLPKESMDFLLKKFVNKKTSHLFKKVFSTEKQRYEFLPSHIELFERYRIPENIIQLVTTHISLLMALVVELEHPYLGQIREKIRKQVDQRDKFPEDFISFYMEQSQNENFLKTALYVYTFYLATVAKKQSLSSELLYKLFIPFFKYSRVQTAYTFIDINPILNIFQSSVLEVSWFEELAEHEKSKREKIQNTVLNLDKQFRKVSLDLIELSRQPLIEVHKMNDYKKLYLQLKKKRAWILNKEQIHESDLSPSHLLKKYNMILYISQTNILSENFLKELFMETPVQNAKPIQIGFIKQISELATKKQWPKNLLKLIQEARCRFSLN